MASISEILRHFEEQAAACEKLGSPFTARVCRAAAARLDGATGFGARVRGWTGDPLNDALALRVTGALHGLARSGRSEAMRRAWPPEERGDLGGTIAEAVREHDAWLSPWLDGPPQTNEVGRSAILLGGFLEIARRTGLPMEMWEIGSSAGLSLHFDAWSYDFGGAGRWGGDGPLTVESDWRGRAPDLGAPLEIVAREGVDVAPLDPGSAADRARMLAYIWPDQPARLARAEAAMAYAAEAGAKVARGDAGEWIAERLARPPAAGRVRVIAHTIVWQYLPRATKDRFHAALAAAASLATAEAPLAWLRLEPDGATPGAAIKLNLWPGGERRTLGRGDFHGRWAKWDVAP